MFFIQAPVVLEPLFDVKHADVVIQSAGKVVRSTTSTKSHALVNQVTIFIYISKICYSATDLL